MCLGPNHNYKNSFFNEAIQFSVPAHLSLRCRLGDNDGLPQFWLQVHFVVSMTEILPLDWGHDFP